MFETPDLDLTPSSYVTFSVKFHCWAEQKETNQSNNLLLQYSINAGITWNLILKVFYFFLIKTKDKSIICYYLRNYLIIQLNWIRWEKLIDKWVRNWRASVCNIICLCNQSKMEPEDTLHRVVVNTMKIADLTNCTRLRLWQPVHAGMKLKMTLGTRQPRKIVGSITAYYSCYR